MRIREGVPTDLDLLVIGGGPNGLFAAQQFQSRFPHWEILVAEKGRVAANISDLPEVRWHSQMDQLTLPSQLNKQIVGLYRPTSSELARYYQKFAAEHRINVAEGVEAHRLWASDTEENGGLSIRCAVELAERKGNLVEIQARYCILSTGVFGNPRKLEGLNGSRCHYGIDLALRGKRIVVVGGGNSAADAILHLLPFNQVFWVLRGEKPRRVFESLKPQFESVIEQNRENLTMITMAKVESVSDGGEVRISDGQVLEGVDSVLVLTGHHPLNSLVINSNLTLNGESIRLSSNYETSLSNLYVFGSAMAVWNEGLSQIEPTYIDNGNPDKLATILSDVIEKTVREIFRDGFNLFEPHDGGFGRAIRRMLQIIRNFLQK